MKKMMLLLLSFLLCLNISACSPSGENTSTVSPGSTTNQSVNQSGNKVSSVVTAQSISVDYDEDDLSTESTNLKAQIKLNGDSYTIDGQGAKAEGSTITITDSGSYSLTGTMNNGKIVIDQQEKGVVRLILNGVSLACSSSSPIEVKQAGKVVMTLVEGTENSVIDGNTYVYDNAESDEPNAAIFSKAALTINGTGSLSVNGRYQHGIASKDELKIISGTLSVSAVADGIKGRDYVAIKDGTLTVNSSGDGIISNNDEDAQLGYVYIENGTIQIASAQDGIQAETQAVINGGDITIVSGGGSKNSTTKTDVAPQDWGRTGKTGTAATNDTESNETPSTKGIKGILGVTIKGGTLRIDSSDDAVHSNYSVAMVGGTVEISAGDDGIHADSAIEIDGGELTIHQSYEGIESAIIAINNGNIHVVASDDGINVAGGTDNSSANGGMAQDEFAPSDNNYLLINGGYLYVDANGDGLDSNGSIIMTNGKVIVNGPTNSGNGALDYNGSFQSTGGILVASGSSGMAQQPDATSSQNSVMISFESVQEAGTLVHIQSEDGKNLLTFAPAKAYQTIVFSSPSLEKGKTYQVYTGGTSTGKATDGLYEEGSYNEGTQIFSFEVTSITTQVGTAAGGMNPGRGMRPGNGTIPNDGSFPKDRPSRDGGMMPPEGMPPEGGMPPESN